MDIIDQTCDLRVPGLISCFLNNTKLIHIHTLFSNIQLNQPPQPVTVRSFHSLVIQLLQLIVMDPIYISYVPEPVLYGSEVLGLCGGVHTSAAVVATDNDVLDL
eukprot:TRINITY_DN13912_c0_g1_i2.p1 TRINITY_DN13912_c0_g1~~TRINITY_DN13912_c0_g1_i2.p1  ORF type:complete len:104 (-),score=6.66 TRINITY_DN13912_c0_g1_i2:438-749(-)